MADQGEKTEAATPRARQKARERGQVAKSTELVSAILLFGMFILLFNRNHGLAAQFSAYFTDTAGKAWTTDISADGLPLLIRENIIGFLKILAPYLIASLVLALLASLLQVGLVFSAEPLSPQLSKLNPLKGFQRIFSMKAVVDFLKNILKLAAVGFVGFSVLYAAYPGIIVSVDRQPFDSVAFATTIGYRIGMFCCGLLLVIAILDYIYQKFEFEKSIKMSKQEIKEEYKNMEGDPQIKRRIREMGRQYAMSSMQEQVQRADAVITNPTHYAVAVCYELDWPAPMVVAKGVDYSALRIIRYAEELEIPVYQQPELARALYTVELEQYVPANLFRAVARVLAHLARYDGKLRRKLGTGGKASPVAQAKP
ncbi:flagellar biosynthesis protein FlhB [bacterium]|nr:flagellar biosynthesis protein FlhB [bacterium]